MASAVVETVEHTSGDTRRLTYTVKDVLGAVVDITGATIRWALFKLNTDEAEPTAKSNTSVLPSAAEKTVGSGIVLTDPVNGEFRIDIAPGDTGPLKGEFYQEAEMTLGGDVSTVAFGIFKIKKDGLS